MTSFFLLPAPFFVFRESVGENFQISVLSEEIFLYLLQSMFFDFYFFFGCKHNDDT